ALRLHGPSVAHEGAEADGHRPGAGPAARSGGERELGRVSARMRRGCGARDLAAPAQLRPPASPAHESRCRCELRAAATARGSARPAQPIARDRAGADPGPRTAPAPAAATPGLSALPTRSAHRVPAEDEVHRAADAQCRPEEVEA